MRGVKQGRAVPSKTGKPREWRWAEWDRMRSAAQSHWRYRREALAAFGPDWETSGEPQSPDPLGSLDDDLRPLTLGRVREIVAAARRDAEQSGATRLDGWQSAKFATATIEPGS